MNKWLKALFAETIFSAWWIVSALSTASTFYWHSLSGYWRLVSAISTLVGFAWANFRVFQKQEVRISSLSGQLTAQPTRSSSLKIMIDNRSRYILVPVNNIPRSDFAGMFVEFHLRIENTGLRNSTIDTYAVEVVELRRSFADLRPEEGRSAIQGRHGLWGLNRPAGLSNTRIIGIGAESSTNHGTLLFFLPGLNLESFVTAGLHTHGEQRRFGNVHCRLTVTDTTQSSATEEFEMGEV